MISRKHDTLMVEHGTFVQSVVEMGDGLLRTRMTRISHLLTLFDQIEGSTNHSDIVLIKISTDIPIQTTEILSTIIWVTQVLVVSEMGVLIGLAQGLLNIPGPIHQALLEAVQWPSALQRRVVPTLNYHSLNP
jgi:hypothetical protein